MSRQARYGSAPLLKGSKQPLHDHRVLGAVRHIIIALAQPFRDKAVPLVERARGLIADSHFQENRGRTKIGDILHHARQAAPKRRPAAANRCPSPR